MQLSNEVLITKVKAAQATGTTEITSDIVDMSGYEGVVFFTAIATANAGNYIKGQQGAAANLSDVTDLEGTKVVAASDAQVVWLDIHKPQERYLRASVIRGATTVVGEIYALRYGGRVKPSDNDIASLIIGELHISPDEGTA